MAIAIVLKDLATSKLSVFTISRKPDPLDLNKSQEVLTVVKAAFISEGVLKPEYSLVIDKKDPQTAIVKDITDPNNPIDKASIHLFNAPHIEATVKFDRID